jgi:hypothetical protein
MSYSVYFFQFEFMDMTLKSCIFLKSAMYLIGMHMYLSLRRIYYSETHVFFFLKTSSPDPRVQMSEYRVCLGNLAAILLVLPSWVTR